MRIGSACATVAAICHGSIVCVLCASGDQVRAPAVVESFESALERLKGLCFPDNLKLTPSSATMDFANEVNRIGLEYIAKFDEIVSWKKIPSQKCRKELEDYREAILKLLSPKNEDQLLTEEYRSALWGTCRAMMTPNYQHEVLQAFDRCQVAEGWPAEPVKWPANQPWLKKNLANKIFGYLARCEGNFGI